MVAVWLVLFINVDPSVLIIAICQEKWCLHPRAMVSGFRLAFVILATVSFVQFNRCTGFP